jgi:small-conductance mechanosensitive channel
MFGPLDEIWANDLYRKLILSSGILLTFIVLRRFLSRVVIGRIAEDSPHLYTVRKVMTHLVNVLAGLLVFGVWVQDVGDLSVALGILAAGLAFALQEVIGSIAGWLTIISKDSSRSVSGGCYCQHQAVKAARVARYGQPFDRKVLNGSPSRNAWTKG